MKKPRTRDERILLMSAIYQFDIHQDEGFIPTFEDEALFETYQKVIKEMKEIDGIIEANLFNYRLNRLSYVDRAIIRLAVFEIKEGFTAGPIAINEAIELTKIYTNLDDEKQHKFNNKLLDTIYQAIKE